MDTRPMKKLILACAVLAISSVCYAAGYDLLINQRNAADTATATRVVASPITPGLLYYNTSTLLPDYLTLGANLSIASGVLNVAPAAWSDITGKPSFAIVATTGAYADLTGKPALFDGAYSSLTGIPSTFIPSSHTHPASQISDSTTTGRAVMMATDAATARSAIGAGVGDGTVISVIAGTGLSGGTITSTGTISLPNTGTAGTYSGITTDAQGRVTAGTSASQSSTSRTLNSAFQISSSRPAMVFYSVRITTTVSIGSNQDGDVILEIASDSGFTSNVQTLSVGENGQTVTLAIALNSIQAQTVVVSGFVPTGYYARLRTVNNTGTPTYLYRNGQEVLM